MAINDLKLDDVRSLGYSSYSQIEQSVDQYATRVLSNHMANNAYGINHRQMPLPVPINKDQYGLTFFTRPQLNFQRSNLKQSRIMHRLLTTQELSWQRYIRNMLDPRLSTDYDKEGGNRPVKTKLVDEKNAFIPLLSNNLVSISGWRDIMVPTYTSRQGMYREEYSMVDGITIDYSAYDLTANFRNLRGDPITDLFFYWSHYMSLVFEGTLAPYPDMIVANMLDYCTRVYRLVLDPSKTRVQKIAACGACFPVAVSVGASFDFSIDKPYNDVNAEISIPLRAMGFIVNDDILIRQFNKTVGYFNPDMASRSDNPYERPGPNVTKLEPSELALFNYRGYPRIDPETYELQWYIDTDVYLSKYQAIQNFNEYFEKAMQLDTQLDQPGINYI